MMPRNDNKKGGDCRMGCMSRGGNADIAGECRACPFSRCSRGGGDAQMRARMRRLQIVDFALQELILYLDIYPDCRRALQKYHALKAEREQLVRALQEGGVPITALGVENQERWDWTDAPWPWEYDFAGNAKD